MIINSSKSLNSHKLTSLVPMNLIMYIRISPLFSSGLFQVSVTSVGAVSLASRFLTADGAENKK